MHGGAKKRAMKI